MADYIELHSRDSKTNEMYPLMVFVNKIIAIQPVPEYSKDYDNGRTMLWLQDVESDVFVEEEYDIIKRTFDMVSLGNKKW